MINYEKINRCNDGTKMNTVEVDLGKRSYQILIEQALLDSLSDQMAGFLNNQVLIVTNEVVAKLYLDSVVAQLEKLSLSKLNIVILPDGEQYKHLESVSTIYNALMEHQHNRQTTLVALGGGVVGDMAGFAAATYQRGVQFIQLPTTLLSQVDSSVGGKTGVNHPLGKNMIGAFYQPKLVLVDIAVLNTLPAREVSAGLAEIIKYGLIYDVEFFSWLERNVSLLVELDADAITYAIKRSCEIKAAVVSADETEQGVRAILNLGHTFGHAIEAFMGYGEWLHGEAVGAGMVMAADMSYRMGAITSGELERITLLIKAAQLPIKPPEKMTKNDFLSLMSVDKKAVDNRIRLVLLSSLGAGYITGEYETDTLNSTLQAALA